MGSTAGEFSGAFATGDEFHPNPERRDICREVADLIRREVAELILRRK